MATKNTDNWLDIVQRLNEMSNMTPEEERAELMEAARQEPRILDDKDVTLADIAKLAGIKEFQKDTEVSEKAEKLIESIEKESMGESIITQAINEADAEEKTLEQEITQAVKGESKRLDQIAELEAKIEELKSQEIEENTYDPEKFKEKLRELLEYFLKNANTDQMVDMYKMIADENIKVSEDGRITIETIQQDEAAGHEGSAEPRKHTMKGDAEEIKKKLKDKGIEADVEQKGDDADVHTMSDKDAVEKAMKEVEYKDDLTEDAGEPITEEEFDILAEKKDACYHKVKSRYKVWPSAYASGALAKCRKVGAANWGNKSKK